MCSSSGSIVSGIISYRMGVCCVGGFALSSLSVHTAVCWFSNFISYICIVSCVFVLLALPRFVVLHWVMYDCLCSVVVLSWHIV